MIGFGIWTRTLRDISEHTLRPRDLADASDKQRALPLLEEILTCRAAGAR